MLADGAGPTALEAMTEYDVLIDGAVMLTEHEVDEMPLLHAQEVSGLPLMQLAVSVTVVPAVTGVAAVFGDCAMLQPLGAVPGPTRSDIDRGIERGPGPEAFDGVTV